MVYLARVLEKTVLKTIASTPVTAITGPRQCGKSTLVRHIRKNLPHTVYLDLERPSDLAKLGDAELFFASHKDRLICIDEVQRKPEIFPLIRSLVDEWGRNACFLVLGSASRDMLRQSSETLAGRISYKRLTPFLFEEMQDRRSIEEYVYSGGFPRSVLASDASISFDWRENFITTFLERDLLHWKGFTPATMQRLWQMLAHHNGQTANYSSLASSLGISDVSVKHYIDLLASAYMVEVVPPYFSNLKKRLVKAPKVYVADSGITTALLGIKSFPELSGHPALGAAWESAVLANIKGWHPNAEVFHYRTSGGAEIDFVVKIGNAIFAIECKASYSAMLSKGNHAAIEDISPRHSFVVFLANQGYAMKPGITAVSLPELKKHIC
jgi:predicted AAA+ superfamily ATPase